MDKDLIIIGQRHSKNRFRMQGKAKNHAEAKIAERKRMLEKTKTALEFIEYAGAHVLQGLRDSYRWRC